MYKKFDIRCLLIVPLLIFFSCDNSQPERNSDKILAVSSISIIDDIVKHIGGDKVETMSICGIGVDPHSYISKPSDPRTISQSDIVFINGLGLEKWIEQMIRNAGGERPVVIVTEGIATLTDEAGFEDIDPHAWFDLSNAKIYAKNIAEGLISIDPDNRDYYYTNLDKYLNELDNAHTQALELISELPQDLRILITSHDAFRYFGNAYGLEVHALQGISTESKPRTEDVKNLIDLINSKNVKAVFIETTVNPALLQQVTSETGAVIGGTLYSDSIGEAGSEGDTFIKAFLSNVKTITEALK